MEVENMNTSSHSSLIHEHLKKQHRKELLVTPIFQHRNNEDIDTITGTCNNDNNNKNANEFERKVIDRIVTPIPFNLSIDSSYNDKGDIEVCIEEYYRDISNSFSSPFLRRVAVRSYLGVVEEKQVGLLHASFSLPVGDFPRNIVAEMLSDDEKNGQNNNNKKNIGRQTDDCNKGKIDNDNVISKNWLCWTKFQSTESNKNDISNADDYDDEIDDQNTSRINGNGKIYLCVLAGPRTLKIFDVYPKTTKSNSDKGDEFNQAEGQTITLPFNASSIFSLPAPYYGLLIQRAAIVGEESLIPTNEYYPTFSNHVSNNIEINDDMEQINDPDITNNKNTNHLNNNGFVVDGPPSTVRLDLNTNFTTVNQADRQPSPSSSESDSGIDIQAAAPNSINQVIPSLYTLHSQLDDILPCNILPSKMHFDTDSKTIKQSLWRVPHEDRANDQKFHYFANVFEHVIFVGKPRSFLPSMNSDKDKNESDGYTFIVTFNTKLKRHAFWIMEQAHYHPQLNLPLWQQTTQALKLSNVIDHFDILINPSCNEEVDDCDVTMSEQKVETLDSKEQFNPTTSTFSELHAHVSITCIYKDCCDFDESQSPTPFQENVAKNVFFATNSTESGDFVLCLLQRRLHRDPIVTDRNDHKLCSFSIQQEETSSNHNNHEVHWKVSCINCFDCIAAQPLQTTPINPPSFMPLEDDMTKRNDFFSNWRTTDIADPPMAIDICLCVQTSHGIKLRIFREDQHIVDCKIPISQTSLQTENALDNIIDLQYAVKDRVDVLCSVGNDSYLHFRVNLSLVINTSPITEHALVAIASSILHQRNVLEGREDVNYARTLSGLNYALRSDCAIFSQMATSFVGSKEITNDLEWFVFCSILKTFFAFALNKSSSLNCLLALLESTPLLDENEDIDVDGDEAWENLLSSKFHSDYFDSNSQTMFLNDKGPLHDTKSSSLTQKLSRALLASSSLAWLFNLPEGRNFDTAICSVIFDSLHLLYEEMKLSNVSGSSMYLNLLGTMLHSLSSRSCVINKDHESTLTMQDFVEAYERDLGIASCTPQEGGFSGICFSKRVTSFSFPPCIYSLLEKVIQGKEMCVAMDNLSDIRNHLVLSGAYSTMVILLHFFTIYFDKKWDHNDGMTERDRNLIMTMTKAGFHCPSKFLQMFPISIATLFMEVCYRCRLDPPPISNTWSTAAYTFVGRTDLAEIQHLLLSRNSDLPIQGIGSIKENFLVTKSLSDNDDDKDGLIGLEKLAAMNFPNDSRIREVAKLLRSSRPAFLRVQRSVEVSDHDYERQKQEKLSLLCRRVVALSLGRGMLTYGTLDPIPAEPLSIPQLCLAGRIPPRNATIALEGSYWTAEMKVWPEFHNGVAAGLRLPLCMQRKLKSMREIERSWIVYNKPPRIPSDNPQNNNNQTQQDQQFSGHAHGGFLMALGLRGYLSALSMPDIIDYLTKGSVTTAVGILLGMSANKRGTCDMSVSKMLCLHIPSLFPSSFSSIDVVSETQTAAVAGIGLLYQKSSHRMMTEFLLSEIGKRPTNEQHVNDRESYSLSCGIALGMVNLCLRNKNISSKAVIADDLSDLQIEERLLRYIFGGVDENFIYQQKGNSHINSSAAANESERCSRIYEGDMINIDITAPGATLALGMIYLRSGNTTIAKQLALPETIFALDKIRPDFLFLNVVVRNLVLWDQVEASSSWIEKQIPTFIREFCTQLRKKLSGDTSTEEQRINFDAKAMKEAYSFIVAGACFSIGLRFAGTGNENARDAVFEKVIEFQKYRDDSDPISMMLRPQRPVVEMCIGAVAISLAMIMAGTGDLKTLRLLKILRWRCDDGVKYGSHMAANAAIGLLFLGGGTCILGQEAEDIASLLVAFFPRFPLTPQDNQYHLQALRHMYSLAVKQRKIEAIDIDSKEKTFIPIKLEYADFSSIETKAPCLLLNRGRLSKIKVMSDRYYPVEIDVGAFAVVDQTINLFVKKRSGRISYVEDPLGLKSNFFQSLCGHKGNKFLDLLSYTSESKDLQVYARYLCQNSVSNSRNDFEDRENKEIYIQILRDCLLREKSDSLPLHLALLNTAESLKRTSFPMRIIWDLRLLRSLYESKHKEQDLSFEVFNPDLVAKFCQRIDNILCQGEQEKTLVNPSTMNDKLKWQGIRSVWFCETVNN